MEGMHSKMFDPPTQSPPTPDLLVPTNPVPEVMLAAGFLNSVSFPNTVRRQLMHGMTVPTWDAQNMVFFVFRDPDGIDNGTDPNNPPFQGLILNPKQGAWPAPTIRVPRGVIFHCETAGSGPPPHTIHWHGQEPTPMNDGVGHCSMELGHYVYQWQPNFIGSYFYHCHRNTVQHFEFGLYGFTVIDPPDAYFATQANPAIPIGAGRDGLFRTAANLVNFPQFGQTPADRVPLTTPDPLGQFPTDPHAFTVPYDTEALWVFDDRDIRWSNLGSGARDTFPKQGSIPGVNDNFHDNIGSGGFFAFNDFRSTHWYCTGFPFPGPLNGSGVLDARATVIPPELMSGKSGVQVAINAAVNTNILLRVLNGAYNSVRVTFPVDIVIIAWDGRALGVPPHGNYNAPVLVPAGTTFEFSVARRFDCLIRSAVPVSGFATVRFVDTLRRVVRFTGTIPINIA
jgi:FtsP/CotA-like multicopper oxidase with cupredoxin domain